MRSIFYLIVGILALHSCNKNSNRFNENRDIAWSDTISTIGIRTEYIVREYNGKGLLLSSYSYGYLYDKELKKLLTRTYHYLDEKLVVIEEYNCYNTKYPHVKYQIHYDDDRLSEVLATNETGDSIYGKSEYKHDDEGYLSEWVNKEFLETFTTTKVFQYYYEQGKLIKVTRGEEKEGVEKYEYKPNGNIGKIIDLHSWKETNLSYNSSRQVINNGNETYEYDKKGRINTYNRVDEMLGDTTFVRFMYGHRPDDVKDNNRFVDDGGLFVNSRGQVYYKLCDINNNYLPDGMGIREQMSFH